MADEGDSVTEVTTRSWFERMTGSFVAALVGLAMFVASFFLLYWNEGNVVGEMDALNAGAKMVVTVAPGAVDPANEGRLVHVSAMAAATAPLLDPQLRVGQAGLMRLRRHVEMYQWQEHEESKSEKSLGGSETTTKTWRYTREWVDKAVDSTKFKRPADHGNPPMPFSTGVYTAQGLAVGAFALDPAVSARISDFQPLALAPDTLPRTLPTGFRQTGDQLYRGAAPEQPALGDVRISFEAVRLQPVSVVAAQAGQMLTPFHGKDGRTINLVALGTWPPEALFQTARDEARLIAWILRGVGFLLMLIGLVLASSPLSWLVSVVPFLDGVVGVAAFFMALVVSVPLTLFTIAVAWLAHRPLLAGGLIIAGALLALGIWRLVPRRRSAGGRTAAAR